MDHNLFARLIFSSAILFAVAFGGCGGDGSTTSTGGTAACRDGQTDCDGICVNTANDNTNCGSCGNACAPGEICNGSGSCALSCQTGLTDCNGTCVNTNSDNAHCGDCTTVCNAGEVCNGSGSCALSCQTGLTDC
ncbi:MAG TPA: hypothetical protein PK156_14515, partial [Polyangium sp.]|nr:hypothetical protein [Polyangium sp.]